MKNESSDNVSTPVSGETETLTRSESTTASEERWLPIPGYEGLYEVSDLGRVRSKKRSSEWRLINPKTTSKGYKVIGLYTNGNREVVQIHRLVLSAFVGPRPKGCFGCHNNGIASDNKLPNLRWDTQAGNMSDKAKHGTTPSQAGSKNPRAKLTESEVVEIRRRLEIGHSQKLIAKDYAVAATLISQIHLRQIWTHV
jgi:hypothetical protein